MLLLAGVYHVSTMHKESEQSRHNSLNGKMHQTTYERMWHQAQTYREGERSKDLEIALLLGLYVEDMPGSCGLTAEGGRRA